VIPAGSRWHSRTNSSVLLELDVGTDSDTNKELIRRRIAFGNAGFARCFEPFISDGYIGHLALL